MDFSEALLHLKDGKSVCRQGWNGKDQYVYFVPGGMYPPQTDIAKAAFPEGVPYDAYLALKNVQGHVVPWLASQGDLLAMDWTVVEVA